jgi:hypothetical protein
MARFLFLCLIFGAFLSFSDCVFADDDKGQQTEKKPDDEQQIDDNSSVGTQDNDMLGMLSISIHTNTFNPALALGIINGTK